MTKAEAIEQVLKENGGSASWPHIYNTIEQYYPAAKASKEWKAGIRGVLYRDLRQGKRFKKISLGVFALLNYQDDAVVQEIKKDAIRMHSFVEGQLLEIGNHEGYETFCADPSAQFRPGVPLHELCTLSTIPKFTYPELCKYVSRIDVLYFSKNGYPFPQRAFEVVDSISTLHGAFERLFKLQEFQTELFIVIPEAHRTKVVEKLSHEPFVQLKDRISIKTYEEVAQKHQSLHEYMQYAF